MMAIIIQSVIMQEGEREREREREIFFLWLEIRKGMGICIR